MPARAFMLRVTPDEAAALPLPPGRRSALVAATPEVEVRHYAPRGTDPQVPHDRDELYVVLSGRGTFVCDAARTEFAPGDLLFAAAHADHRFEAFSEDFACWVMFFGPVRPAPA